MPTFLSLIEFVGTAGVLLILWLIRFSAPKYIEERIKGLAQKADLKEIREITERIRSQFDRGNVVHRVQFEAEFRAYQEIYLAAHHAVVAHYKWRSVTFATGQEQLRDFSEAQLKFCHLFEGCDPFIPENIVATFRRLSELFTDAKIDEKFGVQKTIADIRADRKAIDLAIQECSTAIRLRLESLVTL